MKERLCEKCGNLLKEDTEEWKTLCYKCYKYNTFQKGKKIKNVMDRLNESNIVHNQGRKW